MKIRSILAVLLTLLLLPNMLFSQVKTSAVKQDAFDWIDSRAELLNRTAKSIWEFAEIAYTEYKSAEYLSNILENEGFRVTRNAANIPMAFVAEYGSGSPVIGILGELDALPGLSQQAGIAEKISIDENGNGHGCGHNLLGVGSAGAAMAVKHAIQKYGITGTVKFFGCPAEETGDGKVFMAREGLFDDLDICLDWHPGTINSAILQTTTAVNDFEVIFAGKTAHAAGDPWNGRSSLDAVELMNIGVNFLREHIKPTARIHYVITDAGKAPNVVPDRASVWYFVRDIERRDVEAIYGRVLKIAEGAALMTDTEMQVDFFSGIYNYLNNRIIAEVLHKNLELVGPPQFTESEQEFARVLQRTFGKEEAGMNTEINELKEPGSRSSGGSTDAADVSWIVPTARIRTACWPLHTPGHSWGVVTCTGSDIGFRGMRTASKVLAATALEAMLDTGFIEQARKEFQERTANFVYKSAVPEGQPPRIPVRKK